MQQLQTFPAVVLPPPPCPVDPDLPGPLREQLLRDLTNEAAAQGVVGQRALAFHGDRTLQVELQTARPLSDEVRAGAWACVATQPGTLRSFRTGTLEVPIDGEPTRCACLMERLPDGRFWFAWWPIPEGEIRDGQKIAWEAEEGPGLGPLDALAERWLNTTEDVPPVGLRMVEPPDPAQPVEGSAVVMKGAPLVTRVPRDLDGLAGFLDRVVLQDKSLLQQAVFQPPAICIVRGDQWEHWTIRRPQPASLDDLVRNLCRLYDPEPHAVFVLEPSSVLFQGEQRKSIRCTIERRRRRLIQHLPLVTERREAVWMSRVRRRIPRDQAWIGVPPSVDLDLKPDGGPFGSGGPAEA